MESEEILSLYKHHELPYFKTLQTAIEINDSESGYYRGHRLNSAMKSVEFSAVAERLQCIEQTQSDYRTWMEISQEIKLFMDQSIDILEQL